MSSFDAAGIPGGIPALAPDQVAITPDGRGSFYLHVGRRDRVKGLWLSAASVAQLPAAVAEVTGPVTTTRKRRATPEPAPEVG
jgi:hypothetical protein